VRPCIKIAGAKRAGGMAQMVETMPLKFKPQYQKKKKISSTEIYEFQKDETKQKLRIQ
jgi:hypothetical protein